MLYKCKWCGCLFEKLHNKQQYCCDECRHQARLESKRRYIHKRMARDKLYNTRRYNVTRLGSLGTNTRSHPIQDFERERESVRQELKMLGLSWTHSLLPSTTFFSNKDIALKLCLFILHYELLNTTFKITRVLFFHTLFCSVNIYLLWTLLLFSICLNLIYEYGGKKDKLSTSSISWKS